MKKNLFFGLLLGALLTYLSVRGIPLQAVAAGFKASKTEYLLLSLLLMLAMQVLRTVRWGAILRPLEKIGPLVLFSVTNVGFLAIVALPARLGELVRPYLITGKSGIKMSSALGTILVERVCDSLTIMTIFGAILFFMPFPLWVLEAAGIFFIATLIAVSLMIFLIFRRETTLRAVRPLFAKLPAGFSLRLDRIIHSFIEGFRIIHDSTNLLYVLFLSALIWLVDAAVIYVLFFAFNLQLPLTAAFALMIVLVIGIAIPAAPGFIGNWHFFCILGLGLFDVPRPEALAFAVIYHFLSIGIVIILGLIFLPFNRFSVADVRRQFNRVK